MRERLIIHLLDNEGKFIDEKEIFINHNQKAFVGITQERIENCYEVRLKND